MTTTEKRKLDDFISMLSTDIKNAKELQELYEKTHPLFNLYQGRICCLEQVINKLKTFRFSVQ